MAALPWKPRACREQSPDTNNPGEKAIYIPGGDEKLATLPEGILVETGARVSNTASRAT